MGEIIDGWAVESRNNRKTILVWREPIMGKKTMNYDDAEFYGKFIYLDEWRLPTAGEMGERWLENRMEDIGRTYWVSDKISETHASAFSFKLGIRLMRPKTEELNVLHTREITSER